MCIAAKYQQQQKWTKCIDKKSLSHKHQQNTALYQLYCSFAYMVFMYTHLVFRGGTVREKAETTTVTAHENGVH